MYEYDVHGLVFQSYESALKFHGGAYPTEPITAIVRRVSLTKRRAWSV